MVNRWKWLVVLFCTASVQAEDLYVAMDGNDANPGTLEQPLATLQAAAGKLRPGNTCFVRGGTYSQPLEINGLNGTVDDPIIFRAYGDEGVVLDGTEKIESTWEEWTNGIFRAQLNQDMWQLFSGRTLLDLARWPNASVNDGSVWDVHASMRSTDRNWNLSKGRLDACITQPGVICDQNHSESQAGVNTQTLAQTGIDFTGAIGVLNIGHWLTWARPILSHEAGSNQFTFDPAGTKMRKFLEYYIFGLPALDRANEWWFDADSKTVYFKPESGNDPATLELRAKVRDFNLRATDCAYVQFFGY